MPYAPGVVNRSGELFARGIDSASTSIAGAMIDYGKQKREAKAADALYAALKPGEDPVTDEKAAHPIMPEDQWNSLGWRDKTAVMGSVLKAQTLKAAIAEQKQKAALTQAQIDQEKMRTALAGQNLQAEQAGPAFVADVNKRMAGQPGAPEIPLGGNPAFSVLPEALPAVAAVPGQPLDQAWLGAAGGPSGAGAMSSGSERMLRALEIGEKQRQGKQPKNVKFVTSPTGAVLALSDTGVFQYDPNSKAEAEKARGLTFEQRLELSDLSELHSEKRILMRAREKLTGDDELAANDASLARIDAKIAEKRAGKSAPKGNAAPTITTQAHFDALNSGDIYIGKDGQQYRKP